MAAPLSYVIVQSTPFCNIDCAYCYLPGRSDRRTMTPQTLRRVFEGVFESGRVADRLHVIWHAGEPLVLSPDYYRAAMATIAALAPPGVAVTHGFNSNGILLDAGWCAFFKETGASIGLSIDGPRELHDAFRKTRAGQGTFDAAMRGLALLRAHGVDFYVISVLTRASLSRAAELYAFYRAEGIRRVCFNIEEIEGAHTESTLAAPDVAAAFDAFLRAFWNEVVGDGGWLWVREFNHMFREILRTDQASIVRTLSEPFVHLNVDWQGRFSTFSPELLGHSDPRFGDFVFGDLVQGRLADALDDPKFQAVKAEIDLGVARCRETCEYFPICGGGPPTNKLAESGRFDVTETMFCRLMKKTVANVALDILDTMAGADADPADTAADQPDTIQREFS